MSFQQVRIEVVLALLRVYSCSFVVKRPGFQVALLLAVPRLDLVGERDEDMAVPLWGRTGFDLIDTPEAACRGRCVGLVNHRIKQIS